MSSVETNVNSYDAGQFKTYNPDKTRGKWQGKWDFYLSCIGHAFGVKNFMFIEGFMRLSSEFSVFNLIPSIFNVLLFVVPVFFVQSFMGQFSSTGYLSVFRISPLFKGIGYVILALNFTTLIYYSSIATYPLLFFFNSFTLNTTWMYCDNSWNTANCAKKYESDYFMITSNDSEELSDSLKPAAEYCLNKVLKFDKFDEEGIRVSWTIVLGGLFLWIIVAASIFNGIEMIGRILRYTTLIALSLGLFLFVRVLFLPEFGTNMAYFFKPNLMDAWSPEPMIYSLLLCTISLGNGWGTALTMASYQPFKKNTERYSVLVPFSIIGITFLVEITIYLIQSYMSRRILSYSIDRMAFHFAFASITYFFGTIEASQMWSMIFFLMLFLFELNSIILQAFSIITAICDEYESLREYKKKISVGLCGVCCILSWIFATNYTSMTKSYSPLGFSTYFDQMLICFLEIVLIVWIYGRLRFLRDIEFMLSRKFAVWKFYLIRFITPAFILATVAIYLMLHLFGRKRLEEMFVVIIQRFIKGLPWLFIPGYIIGKLLTTTGTICERVKKCIQPNDWYPTDPLDKQRYELTLGTSDISQQLLEMEDHEVP